MHRYGSAHYELAVAIIAGLRNKQTAEEIKNEYYLEQKAQAAASLETSYMLINIYFRTLLPHLTKLNEARREIEKFATRFNVFGVMPQDGPKYAETLNSHRKASQECANKLKLEIYIEADRLLGRQLQSGADSVWKAFVEKRLFPEWPKDSL